VSSARNRDPITIEEAVELFLAQRRSGSALDAVRFAARHADLGRGLVEALEAVEALEDARAPLLGADLERIGPHRLVRELGRGGMGIVFEAEEEPLQRRVALKLLAPELASSAAARARFKREAELAARLVHPSICTVYGAGFDGQRMWIAMRLVEGRTLAQLVLAARERKDRMIALPGSQATGLRARSLEIAAAMARIARALEAAHTLGVLHRDVKPANIMVTPAGEPVLLDFGLARDEGGETASLTRTGETAGTPAYLPPELLSGEIARPDARCDVYALGVTLYECLALRTPFQGPTRDALYRAILSGATRDLAADERDIPRDLSVVVATALERDRARRYASAADFAADLEAVAAGRMVAARPVRALGKLARWMRREPRQAVLAGLFLAALLGLAVAGGVLWASRDKVLAADRASRESEIERWIGDGYQQLSSSHHDEADASFARALEIEPASDEARKRLENAPRTPAFDGLRALAGSSPPDVAAPARADDADWLLHASALELFIDGQRLRIESDRSRRSQKAAIDARALVRLNEAVIRAPSARALYHRQRALAAQHAGDDAAVRSAAGALLALWPSSAHEIYSAAHAISRVDPAAARVLYERALEMDPSYTGALHNLGVVCSWLGDYDAAVDAYRRVLALEPRNGETMNALGASLMEQGCTDEGREAFEAAVRLEPGSTSGWSNLALLEIKEGRLDAARTALERTLALDPGLAHIRASLGYVMSARGELDAAHGELELAISLAPRDAFAWGELAELELRLGHPERALEVCEAGSALAAQSHGLSDVQSRALRALGR
jgi:Tfp pilus assembly protein PilF/tRNA A-37 threonylcarbamoyl transferase component Bud32